MRQWLLIALELLFVAIFVLGVYYVYWPAALLVIGVVGVVACERWAMAENVKARK